MYLKHLCTIITLPLFYSLLYVDVSYAEKTCGKLFHRGSTKELYNFTVGSLAKSSIVVSQLKVGVVQPEPGCSIELSQVAPYLHYLGVQKNGFEGVRKVFDLGNTIGHAEVGNRKFCCYCGNAQCLRTELDENTCAQLFQFRNCNSCLDPGFKVQVDSRDPNLSWNYKYRITRPEYRRAENSKINIISAVVNWGCKLKLFEEPNFEGEWKIFYNGYYDYLGNSTMQSYPVGSFTCDCIKREQVKVGEWITLVSNTTIDATKGLNSTTEINKNKTLAVIVDNK